MDPSPVHPAMHGAAWGRRRRVLGGPLGVCVCCYGVCVSESRPWVCREWGVVEGF